MLSQKAIQEIEAYKARYPDPRSALMPALYVAQEENGGYLSKDALRDVAEVMDLTPADVESVASDVSSGESPSGGLPYSLRLEHSWEHSVASSPNVVRSGWSRVSPSSR